MKHFLLYAHGGSYNHGAEAIVKCTIAKIRAKHPDAFVSLSSHFSEQDREFNVDADEFFDPCTEIWQTEKTALPGSKKELAKKVYAAALNSITPETTLYSVGGDNFCYDNWHRIAVFQEQAAKNGARSILWCCSIEPESITPEMTEVLNTFDIITARESLTYNALERNGIKSELHLVKDIAFALEPLETGRSKLKSGFIKGNFIGINISPLILNRETVNGIVMQNYHNLISYILNQTDFSVALIPHVVMPMDNDYTPLSELFHVVHGNLRHRVWLVSDKLSAAEYKYIISNCKAMVTARTHAAIAAYSCGVPCLAIGYSIKSFGIAKDLEFGDFVLDINSITTTDIIQRRLFEMV